MNTSMHRGPAKFAGLFDRFGTAPQTVLVPMLNMSVAGDMLHLAAVLALGHRRSPALSPTPLDDVAFVSTARPQPRIVVLGVVEVPDGQPLTTGMDMARSYRAMFDFLPSEVDAGGRRVRVDRLVKVARDLTSAVRLAVEEEHAVVVLAYWKGHARLSKRYVYGHSLDALLKEPPCDVILARPEGWHDCSRVLLPVQGDSSSHALDIALLLAEHDKMALTVLHNVPPSKGATTGPLGGDTVRREPLADVGNTSVKAAVEAGPYIEFNEHLEAAARKSAVQVERLGTVNSNTADAVLGEIQPYDIVIMGLPALPQRGKERDAASSLPLTVAAGTSTPMLLLRTREGIDAGKQKAQARQPRLSWVDMPFEYWFVDNTYHGDEFRDPEEFLKLKRAAGQTISVALLTSNDARHMRSLLTGLKRVLMEMLPLADQLAVIDAGSGDDTLDIARSLGVDAYLAAHVLPDEGGLHGRGESWWKSLGVLRGDIIVWLDPRATRFHPTTALSLAGPLLRRPSLQLVKGFASTPAKPDESKTKEKEEHAPEGRMQSSAPADMSWGGFVVPRRDGAWPFGRRIRVQSLKPADLAALSPAQFATLPPRTIVQALYPSLAGVVEPFGRDVAGRRDAMLSIPALTGHNLELGMLLSVAQQRGSRAVAQVELRHAQPAPPPQPGLRNAIDALQVLSMRLDDPQVCRLAADTAVRLQKELEGPMGSPDTPRFDVRALNPVERPPMKTVLKGNH